MLSVPSHNFDVQEWGLFCYPFECHTFYCCFTAHLNYVFACTATPTILRIGHSYWHSRLSRGPNTSCLGSLVGGSVQTTTPSQRAHVHTYIHSSCHRLFARLFAGFVSFYRIPPQQKIISRSFWNWHLRLERCSQVLGCGLFAFQQLEDVVHFAQVFHLYIKNTTLHFVSYM